MCSHSRQAKEPGARGGENGRRHQLRSQIFAVLGQRDHTADLVFQLPNIAGIVEGGELFDCARGNAEDFSADRVAVLGSEELGEDRNVVAPFAQRQHLEFKPAQAQIKVLPELHRRDEVLERAVGGGDDPNIGDRRFVRSDRLHLALLQKAQQADLKARRDLRDFVVKHRPAVRRAEQAETIRDRAGVSAALVSEQFRLQQVVRHPAAILHHQRTGSARRVVMDRARDQFLSRPGLAVD